MQSAGHLIRGQPGVWQGSPLGGRDAVAGPGLLRVLPHGGNARALGALEAMIGLPAFHGPHPAPKPPVLGLGVIAEAMRRHAFLGETLFAELGLCDKSGEGGGLEEWLSHFPKVLAETRAF